MSVLNFNVLRRWWDNIVLKNYVEGGTPAVLGPLTVTENGTYAASSDNLDGYSSVTVNVEAGVDLNGIADGTLPSGNVTLDTATRVKEYAFKDCVALTGMHLSNCTYIGNHPFEGSGITYMVSEKTVTGSNFEAFQNAAQLAIVDIDMSGQFSTGYFKNDVLLATIILRHSTVTGLASAAAFDSTPFAANGTGGTAYVPSALISAYQSATNWSTLYAAETIDFVAIEGSQYETKYADGTNI